MLRAQPRPELDDLLSLAQVTAASPNELARVDRRVHKNLRARHSKELGDTGMRTLDRMVRATQKLEATFAQLKSQIQATLAPSRRPPPTG